MQVSENCAICLRPMSHGTLLRIVPCRHLFHEECLAPITNGETLACALCRGIVQSTETIHHQSYSKYAQQDRARIVECAQRGGDWKALAESLGVKYKTAYGWVRSGEPKGKQRGGYKKNYLNDDQIQVILTHLEENPELTLQQLRAFIIEQLGKTLSTSTISNYMDGQLYSLKKCHHRPTSMNTNENKARRRQYVLSLNQCIQEGKDIIWIDETNFNLFCRRTQGWSRRGTRAVQDRPPSRGPNLHVIGAISSVGIVMMTKHRGAFKNDICNSWIAQMLQTWEASGKQVSNFVIVCDNAPCHSRIESGLDRTGATLLRLAPYSPPLNPIETIWSSLKAAVKRQLRIPQVQGAGVGEQRLQYLENIVEQGINTLNDQMCARAFQHSTTFYDDITALRDLPVGQ